MYGHIVGIGFEHGWAVLRFVAPKHDELIAAILEAVRRSGLQIEPGGIIVDSVGIEHEIPVPAPPILKDDRLAEMLDLARLGLDRCDEWVGYAQATMFHGYDWHHGIEDAPRPALYDRFVSLSEALIQESIRDLETILPLLQEIYSSSRGSP